MKLKIFGVLLLALTLSSCEDFLTRPPMDKVSDTPEFWNNENNLRTFSYGLYDEYFIGYRTGWSRTDWFAETNVADWVDDNAQRVATFFTKVAPADGGGWSFSLMRRINIMVDRIEKNTMEEEAKNHWLGVAKFFRAMEYSKLVAKFGDVPYFDKEVSSEDVEALYAPRMNRAEVMEKVLADFQFAAQNVRISDGAPAQSINRDVVNAFMSRVMLFEGTWQRYNCNDKAKAALFLKAAKDAANEVMASNRYKIHPDYKELTTSVDLSGNEEMIIYRAYVQGVVTHSLMAFQTTESEGSSPSRSLIDSYLSSNGLPISQAENKLYDKEECKWFQNEFKNRDPRLSEIVYTDNLYLDGVAKVFAASGYFANRFVNESIKGTADGVSNTCVTDAPVMKLNEVMMNYIEAAAELAELGQYSLKQEDFDKTINKIRDRESVKMPHVKLSGSNLSVNGIVINDPERDKDVSSILWEIRRERRTELVYEGLRFNDLRRWHKLYYADMKKNPKLNLGAWLDKPAYVEWYNATYKPAKALTVADLSNVTLDRSGDVGYIQPIQKDELLRVQADKDYLYPLPLDQITLYEENGAKLEQNPGW